MAWNFRWKRLKVAQAPTPTWRKRSFAVQGRPFLKLGCCERPPMFWCETKSYGQCLENEYIFSDYVVWIYESMNLVFRWPFFGGYSLVCWSMQPSANLTPTCPQPATNHQPPAGGLPSLPSLPWLRKIRRCHCYVMRSLYANISSCPELLGVQHATSPIWPSRYRKKIKPWESGEKWCFFSGRLKKNTEVHLWTTKLK